MCVMSRYGPLLFFRVSHGGNPFRTHVPQVDSGDINFVAPWQAPSGVHAAVDAVLSYPVGVKYR